MSKNRGEDSVFVGFESNLPSAVARSRDDKQLAPPPVDSDLIAEALAAAEPEEEPQAPEEEEFEPEPNRAWLKWLIIALVVLGAAYYGYKRYTAPPKAAESAKENAAEPQAPAGDDKGGDEGGDGAENNEGNEEEDEP